MMDFLDFDEIEAEEKEFLIERAQSAAKKAMSFPTRGGRGGSRGGRGGGRGASRGDRGGRRGRGGRGGRGSGRGGDRDNRRDSKPASLSVSKGGDDTKSEAGSDITKVGVQVGEKRKRAVEPEGGPDAGIRGAAVPVIQSTKKTKTDEAGES